MGYVVKMGILDHWGHLLFPLFVSVCEDAYVVCVKMKNFILAWCLVPENGSVVLIDGERWGECLKFVVLICVNFVILVFVSCSLLMIDCKIMIFVDCKIMIFGVFFFRWHSQPRYITPT